MERPSEPPPRPIDAPANVPIPVDVMLVLDMSKSMQETDLPRDRLDAMQTAVTGFVQENRYERLGIVVFAQKAAVHCPLTFDRATLEDKLQALQIDRQVPSLGTATGDGLGLAVEELRTAGSRYRAVVLLTDGDSNYATRYTVERATEVAKADGVVVHTMLVGSDTPDPAFSTMSVNPKPLQDIAAATGGTFARITDRGSFETSLRSVATAIRAMARP